MIELNYETLWNELKDNLEHNTEKYKKIGIDGLKDNDYVTVYCAFDQVIMSETVLSLMKKMEKRGTNVSDA